MLWLVVLTELIGTLHKKICPYSECPCSEFTEYLSAFSSNTGKCGPEKLPIPTLYSGKASWWLSWSRLLIVEKAYD